MSVAPLAKQACEACQVGAPHVPESQYAMLLNELPNWEIIQEEGTHILLKHFTFTNFKQAFAFSTQVAMLAEQHNHHPEITTQWGKVSIKWWTHKINGLHKTDFILAAKTDLLIQA